MQFNLLSLAGLAVLYLAPAISAAAVAAPVPQDTTPAPPPTLRELKALHNFEDAFALLESVPDSVIDQGDDAARKWIKDQLLNDGADDKSVEKRGWLDIPQCVWELINTLPVGRVIKLIRTIGGWKKTAEVLRNARKNPSARSEAIITLIDIITNFPSVKKECWDDFR